MYILSCGMGRLTARLMCEAVLACLLWKSQVNVSASPFPKRPMRIHEMSPCASSHIWHRRHACCLGSWMFDSVDLSFMDTEVWASVVRHSLTWWGVATIRLYKHVTNMLRIKTLRMLNKQVPATSSSALFSYIVIVFQLVGHDVLSLCSKLEHFHKRPHNVTH